MRSANAMRSSFQSFCFGHSEESLKPTQSSLAASAFCRPRWPAGSLSRATTKALQPSYCKPAEDNQKASMGDSTATIRAPQWWRSSLKVFLTSLGEGQSEDSSNSPS